MFYFDNTKIITDEEISRIALFEVFKRRVPTFKISIIGNEGVGKRTFIKNQLIPIFTSNTFITSGYEISIKNIIISSLKIRFQFWIITSADRFKFLLSSYIMGSSLIGIMYDITNFNTLGNLNENIEMIVNYDKKIPIILIGNKLDLEQNRGVSKETIIEIYKDKKLFAYYDISSITGEGVEKLFELIAKAVLKRTGFDKIGKKK